MTTRTNFLKKSFQMIGGIFAESIQKKLPDKILNPKREIYPPGAIDDFVNKCESCGDCISACPVNCIKFSPDELTGKDLPIIVPSEKACIMCENLQCMKVCLRNALVLPEDRIFPKIGLAEIITDKCLPYNGQNCMTCYDACPLKRDAISMKFNRPVINAESCTGCGICEEVCILEDNKGIKIQVLSSE